MFPLFYINLLSNMRFCRHKQDRNLSVVKITIKKSLYPFHAKRNNKVHNSRHYTGYILIIQLPLFEMNEFLIYLFQLECTFKILIGAFALLYFWYPDKSKEYLFLWQRRRNEKQLPPIVECIQKKRLTLFVYANITGRRIWAEI